MNIERWKLESMIRAIIDRNIKEVPYEGKEVNKDGIVDSVIQLIADNVPLLPVGTTVICNGERDVIESHLPKTHPDYDFGYRYILKEQGTQTVWYVKEYKPDNVQFPTKPFDQWTVKDFEQALKAKHNENK